MRRVPSFVAESRRLHTKDGTGQYGMEDQQLFATWASEQTRRHRNLFMVRTEHMRLSSPLWASPPCGVPLPHPEHRVEIDTNNAHGHAPFVNSHVPWSHYCRPPHHTCGHSFLSVRTSRPSPVLPPLPPSRPSSHSGAGSARTRWRRGRPH